MKRMTITEIIKSYPKYFKGRFGCMDRRNSIYFEITEHKIKCKYPIKVYYHDYDNDGESFHSRPLMKHWIMQTNIFYIKNFV